MMTLVPSSAASVRMLQCVAAGGFSVVILRTISAATAPGERLNESDSMLNRREVW